MRKIAALALIVGTLTLGACTRVDPGNVGIVVNTTGGQKDAKDFKVQRGRIWYNPFTQDVYEFPAFVQNATWQAPKEDGETDRSITFTVEGASINVDVALAYQFVPEKVPEIFVKYRKSADEITSGFLRNKVRAAFSGAAESRKAMDIVGVGRGAYLTDVRKRLNDELQPQGFQFETVEIIGKVRLPENVQNAIDAALTATQKAQQAENELRVVQAEGAKQVAKAEAYAKAKIAEAEGEARANQLRQQTLTDAVLRQQAIEKWDGKFPTVMSGGNNPVNLILKQ